VQTRCLIRSRRLAAAFFLQVPKLCTDLDQTFLHILISGTYNKSHSKMKMLSLFVHFPQPCSSVGRTFPACITTNQLVRFHKKEFDEMLCKLDSTENPRSFKKYPILPQGWTNPAKTKSTRSCARNVRTDFRTLFLDLVQNTFSVRFSYLLRLNHLFKAPRDMPKFLQKC